MDEQFKEILIKNISSHFPSAFEETDDNFQKFANSLIAKMIDVSVVAIEEYEKLKN